MRKKHLLLPILLAVLSCVLLFAAGCDDAKENPVAETYTITFDTGDEETSVDPLTARPGGRIYAPEDPVRDGYRFGGWECDGELFAFDVMPERNITLTARWTKLYKIAFTSGTGTVYATLEYAEGETIEYPESPTRRHYLFDGWLDGEEPFGAEAMPAKDVTLSAKWKPAVTIDFSTFAPDYRVPSIVGEAGDPVSAPTVNRKGFHLVRWKDGDGKTFEFTTMPDHDITLYAEWMELTNLPSVFIDLLGENGETFPLNRVDRETYIQSRVSIENTEDDFLLDRVEAEFRGRGNGSWDDIPSNNGDYKRGYKIKFDKKQSLFGREANKHWVLIACVSNQFPETTMSRNYLAYNMANELFDNIEYSTQAHWVDFYVNGEYRGVYILCEHVRVGEGRVDIESDFLGTGSDYASTGYLVEYDAYAAGTEGVDFFRLNGNLVKYPFTVHSPDPEDVSEGKAGVTKAEYMQQIAYIKDYVQKVYDAVLADPDSVDWATFSELADVDSFVDMYILHELFKNADTGYSSFYLYKKPNGKLYAGPPWDFDATCNATRGDQSSGGIYVADTVRNTSDNTVSELYVKLYRNGEFKTAVRNRWKVLAPKIISFLEERLNDTVYETYKAAMGKNYVKWENKTQEQAETDWVTDIKALKKWLLDRVDWLTKNNWV